MHFLIPVIIGWLALFPRSREELDDLRRGHPLAQRFFGGRPGGFFGDYRRRLTRPGKLILYGSIGLTALLMLLGAVRIELAIRSEEHTSELQSLMRIAYAVFCLKKKN